MNIDVKVNPVYLQYIEQPQFMQIFFGGSSSGKSYFLGQKIVIDNMNGANWLVCRNVARTIRNSTFNEIKKSIYKMGLDKYYKINNSDMVITNTINGRQILFAGLDDPEKIKSITPADSVLHRVFIEEATEVKREAIKQLEKRLRGNSSISKHIVMAFNPILKSHFIYRDYFGGWRDDSNIYEDKDLFILKTTYKDNLFLTDKDRDLLENEKDPYFYNVYSLGNWGTLGHIIFKNWRVEDLSKQKDSFDNLFYGLDFGYSDDPNALIKIHYDRKHKRIYVLDEHYQAGMTDDDLVRVCKGIVKSGFITADGAEPKTIDYLCAHDVPTVPALKGADSINRGIRWLQGHEIIIDAQCQNFKNEIETYHWLEDKYGNAMAKAADVNNHLIDALRYATEQLQLEVEAQAVTRW